MKKVILIGIAAVIGAIVIHTLIIPGFKEGAELNSRAGREKSFQAEMNDIIYAKDARGICYATFTNSTHYRAVVVVPCDKVGL